MLTEEMMSEKERADKLFDFFEALANAYTDIFGARALIELAIDNGFEKSDILNYFIDDEELMKELSKKRKTITKFFELDKPYKFDATDLTAFIYLICAVVGIMGHDVSLLFLIGSAIGTVFCWQAHRINVMVLNIALFIYNFYMFFFV